MTYTPTALPPAASGWRYRTSDQERQEQQAAIKAATASWHDITAAEVRAKLSVIATHPMRMLCGEFLATALRRHATHHLGLLPPEFLKADVSHRLAAE